MIPVDQRPTGRPDTAPRGPAGPAPEPRGPRPSSPRPTAPPSPAPSNRAAALESIVLLLRTAQLVADRKLADADPAARMALAERLRLARRAVADLQTPARRDTAKAAVNLVSNPGGPDRNSGRDGKAVTGDGGSRPVQHPAGRPPLPGGDFHLPPIPTVPSFDNGPPDFEIGTGPLYDALPKRS